MHRTIFRITVSPMYGSENQLRQRRLLSQYLFFPSMVIEPPNLAGTWRSRMKTIFPSLLCSHTWSCGPVPANGMQVGVRQHYVMLLLPSPFHHHPRAWKVDMGVNYSRPHAEKGHTLGRGGATRETSSRPCLPRTTNSRLF